MGPRAKVWDQLKHLREDREKLKEAAERALQDGDEGGFEFQNMLASEITEVSFYFVIALDLLSFLVECERVGAAAAKVQMGFPPGLMGVRPPVVPGMVPPVPPLPGQPVNLTQQQAMEYEETKARDTALEPEVIELVHYFKISDRHARMLNEQLKRRNNTYEEDIASLYEILKGAKNPGDLLMVSIRWMERGVFRGTLTPNPAVEKAAKKYKLDAPSACKLAEVLECRDDPDADLRKISEHLAASNKPSSLVMQMLRDIKAGKPIEPCTRAPAIGSYLHKKAHHRLSSSLACKKWTPTRRSPSRDRRHRGGRGGRSWLSAFRMTTVLQALVPVLKSCRVCRSAKLRWN
ncbi:Uncharacterized protein SCF082_LOCUS500 [Durusdinium trenchii]|uniref:Uncharacterized protein n=1 Tax=Durusdinium trenchii TaxID=1381693 RepID=A0ABP0H7W8_9DINO